MKRELTTVDEVLTELGGHEAVSEITGHVKSAPYNWSAAKAFPATTYVILQAALRNKGKRAPDALWKMRQPAEQVAS